MFQWMIAVRIAALVVKILLKLKMNHVVKIVAVAVKQFI